MNMVVVAMLVEGIVLCIDQLCRENFFFDHIMMTFFCFRNEQRSKAINELDTIGQDLIRQLGMENAFKDPLPVAKTKFTSSLMISKDPRSCPTLFFHDNEYFKMVCILPRTTDMRDAYCGK